MAERGRIRDPGPARHPDAEPPKLHAPYNFVPINDVVVRPAWAPHASHDIPFKDGVCGRFWIRITTVTPLFIGAGDPETDGEDAPEDDRPKDQPPPPRRRFEIDGAPAIPGTSLRGLVSNTVEAVTFGDLRRRIDDWRFAFRDLQNPKNYVQHFTYFDHGIRNRAKAGWLKVDPATGRWRLLPCAFAVVKQSDLETAAGVPRFRLGRRQSAEDKYEIWLKSRPGGRGTRSVAVSFVAGPPGPDGEFAKGRHLRRVTKIGVPSLKAAGTIAGAVVFTGQPQDRSKASRTAPAKATDFVFEEPDGSVIPVPEDVREAFEWGHRDPVTGSPNREWAFFRPKLYKTETQPRRIDQFDGRIPVFYLETPGEPGTVRALGLAMMFRLACPTTTHGAAAQALRPDQRSGADADRAPDFAGTIFGTAPSSGAAGLKGRVRFGHGRRTVRGAAADEVERTVLLLGPKPGFYPAYLRQPEVEPDSWPPRVRKATYRTETGKTPPYARYSTYMSPAADDRAAETDGDDPPAVLRGWKRYPVTSTVRESAPPPVFRDALGEDKPNQKVTTRFTPVGGGTCFDASVDFHNLRRCELGAIVWALTFGGDARLCHALGMAKPYGYGAVRITLAPASDGPDGAVLGPARLEENLGDVHEGADALAFLARCRDAFEGYMADALAELGIKTPWRDSDQVRAVLAMADPQIGDRVAAQGLLDYMREPRAFQKIKNTMVRLILAPYPPDRPQAAARQAGAGDKTGAPAPGTRGYHVEDGETVVFVRPEGRRYRVRYELDGEEAVIEPENFRSV